MCNFNASYDDQQIKATVASNKEEKKVNKHSRQKKKKLN